MDKLIEVVQVVVLFIKEQWRGILAGVIVALLIFGAQRVVAADVLVYEVKGDKVVLEMKACESDLIKSRVKDEFHKVLKNATYVANNYSVPTAIAGCWLDGDDNTRVEYGKDEKGQPKFVEISSLDPTLRGHVLTMWEDGDIMPLPKNEFKPGNASAKKPNQPGQKL